MLPLLGVQETWRDLETLRVRALSQVPVSGDHRMQLSEVSHLSVVHPPQRRPPSETECHHLSSGNEGRVHDAPVEGTYNSAVLPAESNPPVIRIATIKKFLQGSEKSLSIHCHSLSLAESRDKLG